MEPIFYQVELIGSGFLAVMARPRSGDWALDEFKSLHDVGIRRVISLLEPSEAHELGLADEDQLCASANISFDSYPIPDRGLPPDAISMFTLSKDTYHRCAGGESTVVHCRAGIGRSGLVAAAVLLHCAFDVDEAFAQVSKARGVDVPDTAEQAEWLLKNKQTVLTGAYA